jgi:hypothetical protein
MPMDRILAKGQFEGLPKVKLIHIFPFKTTVIAGIPYAANLV